MKYRKFFNTIKYLHSTENIKIKILSNSIGFNPFCQNAKACLPYELGKDCHL
jgi:hypothetical protein